VTESTEQNRYQRALASSTANLNHPDDSRDEQTFRETNHKLLSEHAPADGETLTCKGCAEPWPGGIAESAMKQVGVWS
jgi:hypothetical protein